MSIFALVFIALLTLPRGIQADVNPVDYDIVYIRQLRLGDNINTLWPEVFHPARLDAGADLILLHPDGSEEILVDCDVCSVTDPFVSFDAQWFFLVCFMT